MRTARLGLISALLVAGCPAAASASQAGYSGGFVQYLGGPDETNDVTVSYAPGGDTITEAPPETISAVPQCVQQGPNQVFCPTSRISVPPSNCAPRSGTWPTRSR